MGVKFRYTPTSRRRTRLYMRYALLFFLVYNFFEVLYIQHRITREIDVPSWKPPTFSPVSGRKIYIASIHWNNEAILRERWNQALIDLVTALNPKNVFVSIYESGSWDGTKGALRELEGRLADMGTPMNFTYSDATHADEMAALPGDEGWIMTSRGKKELRRIPYLARLRNISLRPLVEMHRRGQEFDRVLFLNDVAFTTEDVFELLNTNDAEYAAACSLDFSKPPVYYDTFALRDAEGREHVMQTWPYFRSAASRHQLKLMNPIPVSSCWNGMVAMPTTPFTSPSPLHFRSIPDSLALHHLEASECCLIHADNPNSPTRGVFVNPRVRVGYTLDAYQTLNPGYRVSWLSSYEIFFGLWENRLRRWIWTPSFKEWRVSRRFRSWQRQNPGVKEPGRFCLINEMQVLVENGWKHL